MDDLIREALRENRGLAQQRAAADRARSGVREARGRYLPAVGINARYSEYSGVIDIGDFVNPAYAALNGVLGEPRFPTNVEATLPLRQETRVELVQPIFAPAVRSGVRAADAAHDMAESRHDGAARRLAADVQLAWLGARSAERVVETLESAGTVLEENLRVSERLVAAGQATPDVPLRARAERSELQQQLADARRQRDAARRAFNHLLRRDSDAALPLLSDSGVTVTAMRALDGVGIEALEAAAVADREELREAGSAMALARAQERAASSAFLPTVALSASYGVQGQRYRFDRRSDVALASLVLSWNLFNGGQDLARREQARLGGLEATLRRDDAERAIRMDVRNAWDGVVAARAATVAAADRLTAAARAFTLIERRFGEGLATQVEYLAARSAHTSALLNEVVTRYTLAARAVELERAAALRPLPR